MRSTGCFERSRAPVCSPSGRDAPFALTPLSQLLRADVAGSMRSVAVLAGEPWRAAWYDLSYAVRTGRSAFGHRHGTSFYEWLAKGGDAAFRFDEVMRHNWETLRDEVVPAYDFSRASQIVDVGGGSGALMEAILAATPDAAGAILESPAIAGETRRRLRDAGLASRCRVVAGDFHEGVPDGGDLYVLAFVTHNWDDREAVRILRNCRRTMTAAGRVLVIESLVPAGPGPSPAKVHDLEMLVFMPGGPERTRSEYSDLFASADLELTRVIPTRTSASLMVAAAT
jgi:ubiquinone/menaquinone biosynthesis C-methylase UbiE